MAVMNGLFIFFGLGFVIFVHELGHFVAARLSAVRVDDFSLGFGPSFFSFKGKMTTFNMRFLPLGGFVKLKGMDEQDEVCLDVDAYPNKSFFQKFFILFSGSFFNYLFAFFTFFLILFFSGTVKISPEIEKIVHGSVAERSFLKVGDRLISIDNNEVKQVRNDFIRVVSSGEKSSYEIVVDRHGQLFSGIVMPEKNNQGRFELGIQLKVEKQAFAFFSSLKQSFLMCWFYIKLVFQSLGMLINQEATFKDLAGPVGIVQMASFQLNQGLLYFVQFVGIISLSLGTVNLLPIPALDGGHIFILVLEKVLRKPFSLVLQQRVTSFFMILLLTLMLFIVFNDITQWGIRKELFQRVFE